LLNIQFAAARAATIFSGLILFPFTVFGGPTLVSSDQSEIPLVSVADETLLDTLGISASGQYVLFSDPGTCTIYRKDRDSGELLAVLESSDAGYKFCSGAELSDDGNLVAASPTQLISGGCDVELPDENGNTGCYLGEVTELLVKNISTGEVTEIQRAFISRSAGDIGRIPLPGDAGIRYGVSLTDFAGDGGHAVISTIGIVANVTQPLFRLIDVAAKSSVPLAPPLNADQTIQISSVSISDDGNRLALLASIVSPPNPPEGTYCPGPAPGPGLPPTDSTGPSGVIICGQVQVGRCDVIGSNPGIPGAPSDSSWWAWQLPPPECLPEVQGPDVFIWDRAQQHLTALGATDAEGALPQISFPVISGDGNHAAWTNRFGFCFQLDANSDTGGFIQFPCDAEENACAADNCDTQIILANLLTGTKQLITAPDAESDVCTSLTFLGFGLPASIRDCGIELSDDGSKLLYARTLTHPFGGDWTILGSDLPKTCIDRNAWDTSGEVIEEECLTAGGFPPGPLPGCQLNGPSGPLPCYPQLPAGGGLVVSWGGSGFLGSWGGTDPTNQYNKSIVPLYSASASSADDNSGTPAILEISDSVTFGNYTIVLVDGGPATVADTTVTLANGGTITLNSATIIFGGTAAITLDGENIALVANTIEILGNLEGGNISVVADTLEINGEPGTPTGGTGGGVIIGGDVVIGGGAIGGGAIGGGTGVIGGPIIYYPVNIPSYREPLIWHVYDATTGHTTLVSIDDDNQLFHADSGRLAGNGNAWAFVSRDPRLQDVAVTPLAATEAELDEGCFWSPPGSSASLRVATNDNVYVLKNDAQIIYPNTPVLCPLPDPALSRHVFADDFGNGVDLAVMTFRSIRGWQRDTGNMYTWLGNFSRTTATLVMLNFEISGLSENGTVEFDDNCEIFPPVGGDDSYLVQCKIGALQSREMDALRWKLTSPDKAFVEVKTTIESNENDLRPRSNTDTDRVVIWKPRRPSWWGFWNR
jgi:hypothetical protein